jgi:hypothetical protein
MPAPQAAAHQPHSIIKIDPDAHVPIMAGDAPFSILCSPVRNFLRMTLRGLWDEAIFENFGRAYVRAMDEMAPHGGIQFSLVDGSSFGVQPQEISDRFAEILLKADPLPQRRAAFITSTLVSKVQARQVSDLLNARYFKTVDNAVDWLFGDEA